MILISLCHLNFFTKGIISFPARFDLIPFKLYSWCAAGPFYQRITCHQFERDLVGSQCSGNHHFPLYSFLLLTFYLKEIAHLHQMYCMFMTFALSFLICTRILQLQYQIAYELCGKGLVKDFYR